MTLNVSTWAQKGPKWVENGGNGGGQVVAIDVFTCCDACHRPFRPLELQIIDQHHGTYYVIHDGPCRQEIVLIARDHDRQQ